MREPKGGTRTGFKQTKKATPRWLGEQFENRRERVQ